MLKLSIVIPCFNEAKNLPLILDRFQQVLTRTDLEVILVNNGSSDESEQVLAELLPRFPFARAVKVDINQGYGFGILAGLAAASGEYLGWTHADLQTDPGDVLKALALIEQHGTSKDLYVKGNRKKRPFFDQIFTTGMSLFETLYLGELLWDINAQPNLFHRSFYETWTAPPHDFSLDLFALYLARRQGLKLLIFDVVFPERIHGHSSWNTGLAAKWKFIKRTLEFSVKLKKELKRGVHRASHQHS